MDKNIVKVARAVHHNPQFELLTRFGYISNGILHGLIGLAVLSLVRGAVEEIDQSGVLAPLPRTVYGTILLLLISIGLVALGVSHFVRVALMRKNAGADRKWPRQIGELAKGLAYLIIGLSSMVFLFAKENAPNSVKSSTDFTAHLLALPMGELVLLIIGLAIITLGINFIYRGVVRKFAEALDFTKMKLKRPVIILGIIGYVAKGLTFISLGSLFCNAAVTLNPSEASGLDGAFKNLIALPFGPQLLLILGLGLVVYAIYCVARGLYAKL